MLVYRGEMMNYLAVFNDTHDAIQAETVIKKNKIKVRMVGTPETISAACGLSLRFSEDELEEIKKNILDISFTSLVEIYAIIEMEDGSKKYELLNE